MRKLLVLFALLCAAPTFATTRYIASSAGVYSGAGVCNGQTAITVATFNSTTQSPGDVANVCGTLTAAAGASSFIAIAQSGTSGNPITITGDANSLITATFFSGPAINVGTHSFVTVSNIAIQATANGTNLANQADNGICVSNGSPSGTMTNITVSGMSCTNLYVHFCSGTISTCTDEGGQDTYCFDLWNTSNLTVTNNTCHDANTGLRTSYVSGTYSGFTFTGNSIFNINHGWFLTDSGVSVTAILTSGALISGNHIHDMQNWDDLGTTACGSGTVSPCNHHDGFLLNANSTSSVFTMVVAGNWINGNIGSGASGQVFSFPAAPGAILGWVWANNVITNDATIYCTADGLLNLIDKNVVFVNNTLVSLHTSCTQHSAQPEVGLSVNDGGNGVVQTNNIFENTNGGALLLGDNNTTHDVGTFSTDYGDYFQNGQWTLNGSTVSTLAAWQTTTGQESHSTVANPNLNASSTPFPYAIASASGGAFQSGNNLSSMCSTTPQICVDINGVTRPTTGAWDKGAQEFVSGGSPTAGTPSCSPAGGTYNSAQSVSCSVTGGAPVMCFTTNGITTATNGGTGCTTGTLYSGAISITATGTTLEVIAGGTGFTDGTVDSETYTLTVATPTFNPVAGTYFGAQNVTISDSTAGATITFTTDGSTPVPGSHGTVYAFPFLVPSSLTLQAVGSLSGFNNSPGGSAVYIVNPYPIAPANPAVSMQ